jgi:hypothetical protein
MLTKILTAFAVAASVLLASCGTTSTVGGVTTTTPNAQFAADIAAVKAAVLTGCGFVVDVETVSAIVGTFVPGAALVGTVAQQICAAVTALGAAPGGPEPQVNGIVIHGYFLKPGIRHGIRR